MFLAFKVLGDDHMDFNKIVALLKIEVLPTMGCTEPGAVALGAAYAANVLEEGAAVSKVSVSVSANIFKNGVAVGIPGTGQTGLPIAAALGVIKKNPEKKLSVLAAIQQRELVLAQAMVDHGIIQVSVDHEKNRLWIKVKVETASEWSEAIIQNSHTNLVRIRKNGKTLYEKDQGNDDGIQDNPLNLWCKEASVNAMVEAMERIPLQDILFIAEGIEMNFLAAQKGIAKKLGLGIGAILKEMVDNGTLSDDMINYAKMLTAGAADARMSGENVPVMSSAGSGNHGITAILPVYAVAQKTGAAPDKMIRAVALSHLITIYIKLHTGNLSALCGCAVAAATGASAAITWLLGGKGTAIEAAMKNLIANLTGMICDGGKVGCALKLSTAAGAAVESSLLARGEVVVPDTNGIILSSIQDTIKNLGKISNPGMVFTDKVILEVMLKKERSVS